MPTTPATRPDVRCPGVERRFASGLLHFGLGRTNVVEDDDDECGLPRRRPCEGGRTVITENQEQAEWLPKAGDVRR